MKEDSDSEGTRSNDDESQHHSEKKSIVPRLKISSLFKRGKSSDSVSMALSPQPSPVPCGSESGVMRMVHTKAIKKSHKDFDNLRHIQKLELPLKARLSVKQNSLPIWSLAFSPDGVYLAAAGGANVIWVWTLLLHADQRKDGNIFAPSPIRIFSGHTDEILHLSWSTNNFLLSSSLDTTVKLWHIERNHCLATFKHPDVVASVAFHPTDNRFFATSCLDCNLRLWSIPDTEVAYMTQMKDKASAVAFSPRGDLVLCGCFDGQVVICSTQGLEIRKRLQLGSQLKYAGNLKVTGIVVFVDEDEAVSRTKLLVTSNGSRIRCYDLQTLDLDTKYKGGVNDYSQAAATLSPDKSFVICPCEDHRTYIWERETSHGLLNTTTNNGSYECFRSNRGAVTCALFAPRTTSKLLYAALGRNPSIVEDIIVTSDTKGEVRVFKNCATSNERRHSGLFSRFMARRNETDDESVIASDIDSDY